MKKNPNIIFVMADDMGYGDAGCYNSESKIPTPNIDRLAREGICFTDAHSPSAVCTPTRYGVLTGRYCWRSRLKRGVLKSYGPPLIEPERLTLASMLKESGYETACIGKWHLGLEYTARPGQHIDFGGARGEATRELEEKIDFTQPLKGGPTELGFDYFFGTSGCSTCQPPYGFIEKDKFTVVPDVYHNKPFFTSRCGMMSSNWDHKKVDTVFNSKAVSFIESKANSTRPFFLYLVPSAPQTM